jgi:hypothetical protein
MSSWRLEGGSKATVKRRYLGIWIMIGAALSALVTPYFGLGIASGVAFVLGMLVLWGASLYQFISGLRR